MLTRKDRKIKNLEAMVKNRDNLIELVQSSNKAFKRRNEDLVEENKRCRKREEELLNNIEFLVNNLSLAKKKLLGL